MAEFTRLPSASLIEHLLRKLGAGREPGGGMWPSGHYGTGLAPNLESVESRRRLNCSDMP